MTDSERFAEEIRILTESASQLPDWKRVVVERARRTEIAMGYERQSPPQSSADTDDRSSVVSTVTP
jgi:hypothetical protein